jgi:hypothetical protein
MTLMMKQDVVKGGCKRGTQTKKNSFLEAAAK